MRYAVELSEHNLKVVFRPGRDHHLADLMSRMRRLTPGSVEARQVGDEAQGLTAELAQHTDCKLGSRALNRRDSDLFSPGSAVRRLRNAIARTETAEGKTVAALIADLEADGPSRAWPTDYPERHPGSSEFFQLLVATMK